MTTKKQLVKYSVICGLLFLVALGFWLFLWTTDYVREGVVALQNRPDVTDYTDFKKLLDVMSLSGMGSAGLFAMLAYILETHFFATKLPVSMLRKRWEGSYLEHIAILLAIVIATTGGMHRGGVRESDLYFPAIVAYIVAFIWVYLRIECRWKLLKTDTEKECIL